jgi:hypothetical protein
MTRQVFPLACGCGRRERDGIDGAGGIRRGTSLAPKQARRGI